MAVEDIPDAATVVVEDSVLWRWWFWRID